MAQETVAICHAGRYFNRQGVDIEIGLAVEEAIAGTELRSPNKVNGQSRDLGPTQTKWEVTDETTIGALRRLAANDGGHLACLNFASAKNPGGGFLGGAEAQEELARPLLGLISLACSPRRLITNATAPAARLSISISQSGRPRCRFSRDDEGQLLDQPYEASVITAPAPNAGAIAVNEPVRLGRKLNLHCVAAQSSSLVSPPRARCASAGARSVGLWRFPQRSAMRCPGLSPTAGRRWRIRRRFRRDHLRDL